MFCVAELKHAKKKVTIPVKWVKKVNLKQITGPINNNRDYTIFFSPNEDDVADFSTMVPTTPAANFDYQRGTYLARIQQSFGKQTTKVLFCAHVN